ncbi:hypothetical protein V5740_12165 [Croceibacterium sp. TMG7-5b_MA50]|uniref:hypothetical protein n=1 Tax=Croceibacterium sp. TMG7-5b_MA50 TaxID=3121290 RepID=UPI0032219029
MNQPFASGADAAIERLTIKAEQIAHANAERRAGASSAWHRPDMLWPLEARTD